MNKFFELCVIIVVNFGCYCFGFWIGKDDTENRMRQEAINLGLAEYVVKDAKTGISEFTWNNTKMSPIYESSYTNNGEITVITIKHEKIQ